MSKIAVVEVREGENVVERVSRPVIKGSVLYNDQWYEVQQPGNFIDLWADYPWEAQPLDPELSRLLGWFCQNKGKIEEVLGVQDLVVTEEGVFCTKKKPKPSLNPFMLALPFLASMNQKG